MFGEQRGVEDNEQQRDGNDQVETGTHFFLSGLGLAIHLISKDEVDLRCLPSGSQCDANRRPAPWHLA
jgi:hypothetical protein